MCCRRDIVFPGGPGGGGGGAGGVSPGPGRAAGEAGGGEVKVGVMTRW